MDNVSLLIKYLKEANKTVFFGGAGVSTDSGLKDFRSKDGLYNEKYIYPPEKILSSSFFFKHTDEFYKFYKDKMNSLKYSPNKTHEVLKKLEDNNLLSSIITQNIDGFHTQAGSKNVYELHGSIMRNHCINCNKFYDAKYIFDEKDIPRCNCNGIIKPDVVLYEEMLDINTLNGAIEEIKNADLLIIGGTSLAVYPAASLIDYFSGGHIVLINNDKTLQDNKADLIIYDNLKNVFERIEKELEL